MHKRFNQNYICTDKISLFLLPLNFELFFYIKKEKKNSEAHYFCLLISQIQLFTCIPEQKKQL